MRRKDAQKCVETHTHCFAVCVEKDAHCVEKDAQCVEKDSQCVEKMHNV